MTLFINAMNVHQGGGRTLLRALVEGLPAARSTVALLDGRLAAAIPPRSGLTVHAVPPTVAGRLAAERWLARAVQPGDTFLGFGNLPPLFRSRGRVVVFLQNRLLIDGSSLDGFGWTSRLRLRIERQWLRLRSPQVERFLVQTPTMKAMAEASGLLSGRPIDVMPFVAAPSRPGEGVDRAAAGKSADETCFAYVATGEPHKNHRNLLEAWRLLAARGIRPTLTLTIGPASTPLAQHIETMRRSGLKIDNRGTVAADQVPAIYRGADALIFPSTGESFGLPLIEARDAGLPVIASELDYVRDVASPVETFDPSSPISIARAVTRFLGIDPGPLTPLSAGDFLAPLFEKPVR